MDYQIPYKINYEGNDFWSYSYRQNGKTRKIKIKGLYHLRKKVEEKGLPWGKDDSKKAKKAKMLAEKEKSEKNKPISLKNFRLKSEEEVLRKKSETNYFHVKNSRFRPIYHGYYGNSLEDRESAYSEATKECRKERREELEMELNDLDNSSFDEMMNYEGDYYSGDYYRISSKKREYDW